MPDVSKLSFDARKHAYTFEGRVFSGVTTVLNATSDKSQLINWSANMAVDYLIGVGIPMDEGEFITVTKKELEEARKAHTRKKEAAGTKGTDAHALVEEYVLHCINSNAGEPLRAESGQIQPFVDWAMGEVKQFIAAEQKLYDEGNAVAGTADFFYISKNDELVAGDLKTFARMWSIDPFHQLGAYSKMWSLLTGNIPTKSVVVKMCDPSDERLQKYGGKSFATYERFAIEEDIEGFYARLKLHRQYQNYAVPKE